MSLPNLPRLAKCSPMVLLGLSLWGCQSLSNPRYIPAGIKQIEVVQGVAIPPEVDGVRFQHGTLARELDTATAYCEFELSAAVPRPHELARGVLKVKRGGTAILSDVEARLRLFGTSEDIPCGDTIYYEVDYLLHSERQPEVRRLRCRQAFAACGDNGRYPSRQDIEQALGPAFSIE